ncbi:hypothetical protein QYE76_023848 [Lolium multiflorum]|uniref:Response regulatory domain-containing protein n=1 Tax=Lolium multiflorum TaxID=4521 RepID=A0AAD8RCK6_LOLMU|nr:hypothetical protein QYE76_023848 [Lolium multiflorum]
MAAPPSTAGFRIIPPARRRASYRRPRDRARFPAAPITDRARLRRRQSQGTASREEEGVGKAAAVAFGMSSVAGGVVGAAAVVPVGGGASPLHVLAVDDSSVDRAVISGILRSSRFRVTAVDSGKRALELLGSENNVGMIITDYWMPEMTGYELLKKVKVCGVWRAISSPSYSPSSFDLDMGKV